MCAMLLADLGATVLKIDRVEPSGLGFPRPLRFNLVMRGRKVIALDLKRPEAVDLVLRLVEQADGLIDPFRPGVAERLGIGPEQCLHRNAKLVFGRATGWGQTGPLAAAAGHDLNYIALTGALHMIGRKGQPPTPPVNLLGDYAGGALYLALGMVSAILEARQSGQGQVVDSSIVDGTISLLTPLLGLYAAGIHGPERGTNILDSGAPFYEVYECADGHWISIAPLEPKFFNELLRLLPINAASVPPQWDKASWPQLHALLADTFKRQDREHWCTLLEGTDACFAPVLSPDEAPHHPHVRARGSFMEVEGITQPSPAPHFSRSIPAVPIPPQPSDNSDVEGALEGWLDRHLVRRLVDTGVLARIRDPAAG
jgi:alpha-methylacyl-CoA racemase